MRIVVTGKAGQVARALGDLAPSLGHELCFLGRPEADLSVPDTLFAPVLALKPELILSVGAYTNVDGAEGDYETAHRINAQGPEALAKIARDLDIPIIHLSTDYVFNGQKNAPYTESDATGPINVYGQTKLAGESAIANITPNHVIARTSWVYSPYGQNFVKTMLRLAQTRDDISVVNDQHGCPTSAHDLAQALLDIAATLKRSADQSLRGIFHITSPDEATWAEFAHAIMQQWQALGGKSAHIVPIGAAAYPTPAARPKNSRLSCQKLKTTYGITLNPWPNALKACLNSLWTGDTQ